MEGIWLYALADAQFHAGVSIHSGCLVINHEHLTVTGAKANVSEFLRRVHETRNRPTYVKCRPAAYVKCRPAAYVKCRPAARPTGGVGRDLRRRFAARAR